MFDGFACVTITNSGFLLHYFTDSHFPSSLIPANSVLCNANVLLILHLMPSVTQPTSKGTQLFRRCQLWASFTLHHKKFKHFLCSKRKKKKLVTSAEGRVFVSVFIFVHFPEAVYSCPAQGKFCGVASAKRNVYSDGLKLLGNVNTTLLECNATSLGQKYFLYWQLPAEQWFSIALSVHSWNCWTFHR